MTPTIRPRAAVVLAALASMAFTATAVGQTALENQRNQAIARGIRYLKVASIKNLSKSQQLGRSALAAFALMQAGVDPSDPDVKELMARVFASISEGGFKPDFSDGHEIYEAAVVIMALVAAGGDKYQKEVKVVADFIVGRQLDNGSWHYNNDNMGRNGDTSMSQYALLGLWEAAAIKVPVPLSVWDKALKWHALHQDAATGGFTYHPRKPSGTRPTSQADVSHTMSIGAAGSMMICQLKLPVTHRIRKRDPKDLDLLIPVESEEEAARKKGFETTVTQETVDDAINGANRWVRNHFTIDAPTANLGVLGLYYYLYALERYGTLSKLERIGDTDWFRAGTEFLVRSQKQDGSWDTGGGSDNLHDLQPLANTCFALLFLGRSTEVIKRKIMVQYGRGDMLAGRGIPSPGGLPDGVSARKKLRYAQALRAPIDDVLEAIFQNQDEIKAEAAAIALETANPEELIRKIGSNFNRLKALTQDKRGKFRQAGYAALARLRDYRAIPLLIQGLADEDFDAYRICRNGLLFISRKSDPMGLPDARPTPKQVEEGQKRWTEWYESLLIDPTPEQKFDGPPPVALSG